MRKLNSKECLLVSGQGFMDHCPFFQQSTNVADELAREDFRNLTLDMGVVMGAITGGMVSTSIVAAEGLLVFVGFGALGAGVGMIAAPIVIDRLLFGQK
jgi:hypothetical protein